MSQPANSQSESLHETVGRLSATSPLGQESAGEANCRCSRRLFVAAAVVALLVVSGLLAFLLSDIYRGRTDSNSRGDPTGSLAGGEFSGAALQHPLVPAIEFARQVQANIDENLRDYTATVIKRERIGGQLNPPQVCFVKIRHKPFSVYMNFLAPPDLAGQECIFVEGANDGRMFAHAGSGVRALVGTVQIPPQGVLAMRDQRYPITELGIANLTRRLIEVAEKDLQFGETFVWRNDDAKVGDRPCTSITVMHPVRRKSFLFHVARIFVDKELKIPLHYEAYDWPEKPGDPPLLLESYTYTQIALNPGLTDADFDPNNLEYRFYPK